MNWIKDQKLKDILPFILLTILCFLWLDRPFATPDEARYIEIPREMVVTGDWLTPRLNGLKYFEKPPLMYWMHALLISCFGIKEWIMRLVPAFFGWIGVISTYFFARHLFGRQIALWSSVILSTSILYMGLSRLIILDMPVSIFMTLSIMCGYMALETRKRIWFYLTVVALSAGVMVKGLVAIVLPKLVLLLWMIIKRLPIRPFYPFSCFALFLLLVAPWHVLVCLKNPDFFHKYFIVEHVLRYTTMLHKRYQPFWFFIPILLLGMLPWTFWTLKSWKWKDPFRFLWVWFFVFFLFFSFSNSKLIPYILPVFPALAILTASSIAHHPWRFKILGAALIISFPLSLCAKNFQKVSLKDFALHIKQHRKKGEGVACFKAYHQDIPVYLEKIVTVIDYVGELEFGAEAEGKKPWMVSSTKNLAPVWIISRKDRWLKAKEKGKIVREIQEPYRDRADDREVYWLIYKEN